MSLSEPGMPVTGEPWICPQCGQKNSGWALECGRCEYMPMQPDMQVVDELLANAEMAGPTIVQDIEPRKCRRHRWVWHDGPERCSICGKPKDEARSRRGKQSRNYGNRAELTAARKYGGDKIGHAGGPVDIRGKDFATQMKTHRRKPPIEWTKSFAAMSQDNRCPRMLLRFVQGPGLPPLDYFVFPADEFLQWFGKDE